MSQGTVPSTASRTGKSAGAHAGPQRGIDTILLRVAGEPRLSLLPTLRAAIDRARRTGGRIAVAGPVDLRAQAEAALIALGLPEDRLHCSALPEISRPAPVPSTDTALLNGLALFPAADAVQAWAAALPTDGRQAGEPKDPDASPLFHAYALLADPMRTETMRLRFHGGISWEDARTALVQLVLRLTAEAGRRQAELLAAQGGPDRRAVPLRTAS